MSLRFVLVSFVGLGWAFYELSGGASFSPTQKSSPVAKAPAPAPLQTAALDIDALNRPVATTTDVVAITTAAPLQRPAADPDLRQRVALNQLSQTGAAINSTTAFDGRVPTGGLQLVSLQGGLSAITTRPAPPQPTEGLRPVARDVAPDVRYVRASRVNMRQGPGTNYSIMSRLLANDKVTILEDNGTGWLRLKVDSSGRVGWIAASLLTKKAP